MPRPKRGQTLSDVPGISAAVVRILRGNQPKNARDEALCDAAILAARLAIRDLNMQHAGLTYERAR